MRGFWDWLREARHFGDAEQEALGTVQVHHDQIYDWHIYFRNSPTAPLPPAEFESLRKKDKKIVQRFFTIVSELGLPSAFHVPLVLTYSNQGEATGFYHPGTEDLPHARGLSRHIEVMRRPKTTAANLVDRLVHEFGHVIYHALPERALEVIRRYAHRELRKFHEKDPGTWWRLAQGKPDTSPPSSNIPTQYARPDYHQQRHPQQAFPTHESGSEWFSEVLATLVIRPQATAPFLNFIRRYLKRLGTQEPVFRPRFYPRSMDAVVQAARDQQLDIRSLSRSTRSLPFFDPYQRP